MTQTLSASSVIGCPEIESSELDSELTADPELNRQILSLWQEAKGEWRRVKSDVIADPSLWSTVDPWSPDDPNIEQSYIDPPASSQASSVDNSMANFDGFANVLTASDADEEQILYNMVLLAEKLMELISKLFQSSGA